MKVIDEWQISGDCWSSMSWHLTASVFSNTLKWQTTLQMIVVCEETVKRTKIDKLCGVSCSSENTLLEQRVLINKWMFCQQITSSNHREQRELSTELSYEVIFFHFCTTYSSLSQHQTSSHWRISSALRSMFHQVDRHTSDAFVRLFCIACVFLGQYLLYNKHEENIHFIHSWVVKWVYKNSLCFYSIYKTIK